MTQKALKFVVSGMLDTERETVEKRIASVLAVSPDWMIDGFTDGLVTNAEVIDPDDLLTYIRKTNPAKTINEIVRTEFIPGICCGGVDGSGPRMEVTCEKVVWREAGGKGWDRDQKDDTHTVEATTTWSTTIDLNGQSAIPGLRLTII